MNPDDDDRHWKAGVIYFNRDDPRIFVPKRFSFGRGRTLNFAHPIAWLILAVPIVVAVVAAASRH